MKLAIIFVGTNIYKTFFNEYYNSIFSKFLSKTEKTIFVFSDDKTYPSFHKNNVVFNNIENLGWPANTLDRYKYINRIKKHLLEFDYILFLDPDMYIYRKINEDEFFSHNKIFYGVQHPSFNNNDFGNRIGTFEVRMESKAYVDTSTEDISNYFQGCLWGGEVPEIFRLTEELERNIETDNNNGIMAKWYDESHLNKFLITNKTDTHVFDSGFCYPERWNISFERKIIHIDKEARGMKIDKGF